MNRRGFLSVIGLGTLFTNIIGSQELIIPVKIEEQIVEVIVNLRNGLKAVYKDKVNNIIESPGIVEENISSNFDNLISMHIYRYKHAPKYIYLDAFVKVNETNLGTLQLTILWGALSSDIELEYLFSEQSNV